MLGKKHFNKLIITVSSLLFLYSAYEFKKKNDGENQFKLGDIGKVFKKDNQLRRKSVGSLSWIDIEDSSKLYPGDRVFTGDQAIAQLNLLHTAEIGMGSTTLIKIDEDTDSELKLQAGTGFFTTKLTGETKKATVKLRDASVVLDGQGSEMHVNSAEGKTMVTAVSGKVDFEAVDASGKMVKQTLAPNQMLGLSQTGVVSVISIPAKMLDPPQSALVVQQNSVPVSFKWQNLKRGAKLSLEIAKSQNFDPVLVKKDVTNQTQAKVLLDESMQGGIFWRIVEQNDSPFFHAQLFELQFLDPPVIVNPGKNQSFESPLPKDFEFSWEKRNDFQYDLELEQTGGKTEPLKKQVQFSSFRPEIVNTGSYRLRVRSVKAVENKPEMVSPWSEWRMFAVEPPKIAAIEFLKPEQEAEAELIGPSNEVRFEWSGGSSQYVFLLSTDETFEKPVVNQTTQRNFFQWKALAPGPYFWTVKNDAAEKTGTIRKFKITEAPLVLMEPADKTELFFKDGEKKKVHFAWDGKPVNGMYFFEYAEDKDFTKALVTKKLKEKSIDVQFTGGKNIFWRLRTDLLEPEKNQSEDGLYWPMQASKGHFQTSAARVIFMSPKPRLIQIALEPLTALPLEYPEAGPVFLEGFLYCDRRKQEP